MAVPISPLGDNIVAKTVEAATKTASGLYIPDSASEKPKVAEVVAVGKLVKEVKVGDKIIYESYSNTDVKVDGQEYTIVKEEKVLATVK